MYRIIGHAFFLQKCIKLGILGDVSFHLSVKPLNRFQCTHNLVLEVYIKSYEENEFIVKFILV